MTPPLSRQGGFPRVRCTTCSEGILSDGVPVGVSQSIRAVQDVTLNIIDLGKLMNVRAFLPVAACVLALLSGCAGLTIAEAPPSQAAQDALAHVHEQYSAGQYGAVIRSVATSDAIQSAPDSLRIEAYKLQAFSYCVRDYPQLCEETFMRILQIDSDFTLAPAEAGHPQWGPVFNAAKAKAGR